MLVWLKIVAKELFCRDYSPKRTKNTVVMGMEANNATLLELRESIGNNELSNIICYLGDAELISGQKVVQKFYFTV